MQKYKKKSKHVFISQIFFIYNEFGVVNISNLGEIAKQNRRNCNAKWARLVRKFAQIVSLTIICCDKIVCL